MAHEPRPTPQVTIHDPARAAEPLDLLTHEPAPSRRGLGVLAGLVVVALLVAAAVEVGDRRAGAADERRLASTLDLAVQPEGSSTSYDPGYRTAHLESQVLIVNRGLRDVVVLEATVGGYRLAAREVRVASGSRASVLLQQSIGCSPTAPPPTRDATALVLQVQTLAEVRTVEVPVEAFSGDEAARACGFLPVVEAVGISVPGAARAGDALELTVELSTTSVRPIDLLAVDVGPGLQAQLRHGDGSPVALPLVLPTGSSARQSFTLRLEVTDCDAARAAAASPQLAVRVRDRAGEVGSVETLYELGYLLGLLLDVC